MRRLPFRLIEPSFYSGLFDDPILLVRIRPLGRSLLFDCGQLHHMAKRAIKSIDAIFVSHTHMDHFMGVDTVIRNTHVSPRTIELFGPPGVADKMERKLAAYDWNLAEQYWCTFIVHEIHKGHILNFSFPGPDGFRRQFLGDFPSQNCLYENEHIQVHGVICDHRIPSLAFRLSEHPGFAIDPAKLAQNGLVAGDWLRLLKQRFYRRQLAGTPLPVICRVGGGTGERLVDGAVVYDLIRKECSPAAVGYLTDLGFTEENLEKALPLLKDLTLLVCECSFLAEDREKARISRHLCATDLNELVDRLRPQYLLPMHLSKSYVGNSSRMYDQLELPPEVKLLRIPDHVAPRPLLPHELPKPSF